MNPADLRFFGKRVALAIALLVAATLLAFAPLPRNGFINYDDPDYISQNPQVRAGLTLGGVAWAFTSFSHSNWHPLAWVSHMADVSLFGLAPGGHHAVSLAIHAAAAILLLLTLHLASGALWPSALVAAIFAVHPLHVESVAWASERKDTLCALFWCASLLAYVAHARRPGRRLLSAAVVCHALALLAKPMAVTLPIVLWVLDFWPLGRRARALEKAPFLLLSGASAAVAYLAQSQGGGLRSLEVYALPVRVGNAGVSLVKYLGLALWPSGLSVFYPHPGPSLSWLAAGAAWAVVAAISLLAVRRRAARPWALTGWLWYLVTLLPVIGLVQVGTQAMADRYTYLPLVGPAVAVAWALAAPAAAGPRIRLVVSMGAVAACALLAAAAHARSVAWRDSRTLFTAALQANPANPLAHYNLALALREEGDAAGALAHLREVARILPAYAPAYNQIGAIRLAGGALAEAESSFRTAAAVDPRYAPALQNLGYTLGLRGRTAEAERTLRRALEADPRLPEAHHNLANLLAGIGRLAEAEASYRRAIALRPDYADALVGLGTVLAESGRLPDAVRSYLQALGIDPKNALAHHNLAVDLERLGRSAEAAAHRREAARLAARQGVRLPAAGGAPPP